MKKIFRHYQFKCLMALARLGWTLPLHYSFTNHLGVAIAVLGVLIPLIMDDELDFLIPFAAVVCVIGLSMGGAYTNMLIQIFTIQDEKKEIES